MYLITGGGTGIGQALALALASREKKVLIVGRREKPLQDTANKSTFIEYHCADVSTFKGIDSISQYLKDSTQISALINNAGTLEPITSLKEIQAKDWLYAFNTNLHAALFLTQKLLTKLHHGRVLNIGSGAAYIPIKGWAAYCTSKAALAMLTRCWQVESDSISFTHVMPGIIDTEMQQIARNGLNMDANQVNFYKRLKENKQLLTTETVAAFLSWLLLDVSLDKYAAKEWDIYDNSHHGAWLKPTHQVPKLDF